MGHFYASIQIAIYNTKNAQHEMKLCSKYHQGLYTSLNWTTYTLHRRVDPQVRLGCYDDG